MYGFSSIASTRSFEKGLQQEISMRDKVKEYIGELDAEIKRCEDTLSKTDSPYDLRIKGRLEAIIDVKNDLQGRLDEVI